MKADLDLAPAPAHTPLPTAPFLDTADGLASALPHLAPHARIAVDTEADSLHCYFEKLCLIQISVPGYDCLIDPLAGFPLQPLFDACHGKEIILHGADYDLRLMRRVGYAGPTRVFDTMIGARLCGIPEFSLAALINKYFGLKVTKASQKANWARRPLSPQMADYAVNDTRHLHRIAEIIEAELRRLERWEWFEQSCERAIAASAVIKERDPDQAWRITGSNELRGRASAVLRGLWQWREDEAARVDKPTFHILHNEQLVGAAARFDQGAEVNFPHLQGSRRRRFFLAAETALALPESEWPQIIRKPRVRSSREDEARFHALKKKRDTVAAGLKLDPSLIAPKSVLENLANNFEETVAKMMPWQRESLGV